MSGETCVAGGAGLVGTTGHLHHHRSSPLVPLRWVETRVESGIGRLQKQGHIILLIR